MRAQPKYRRWEAASPETDPLEDRPDLLSSNKGGLFAYLAAVLSNMAQELSLHPKKDSTCAICSDAIHSTQVESEDDGKPVHAVCLEMKSRKSALLESARAQGHGCSLCGQKVPPKGIFFHEGGVTLSYACVEPAHDEPNRFSLPVATDESRRVGRWEARLRVRLKEKGYVRCCECGRLIRAEASQLLGQGWHYCGCLPELWRTGP
ncbi:MAG TPA: hypothetical protein VGA73_03945 [Candidatus Binatia bacterium]